MKKYKLCKKFSSIFLSLLIIVFSFYNSYFTSYAVFTDEEADFVKDIGKALLDYLEDFGSTFMWAASQLGAFVTTDYEKYLKNNSDFKNYFKDKYITSSDNNDENQENYITINQYTNEVTFSKEFMEYFKQSLKEYSEETNGFWLVPTTSSRALQAQYFQYKESYISIQNLISTYGIISLHMRCSFRPSITNNTLNYGYGGFIAADFSPYVEPGYDLVCATNYDPSTATSPMLVNIYDDSWNKVSVKDKYRFDGGDGKIYNDISSGYLMTGVNPFAGFYVNYPKYNDGYLYGTACLHTYDYGTGMLISKDGCRLRVFKSQTALKVYDAGQRTVYFGSDFYNKEPQEITVKFDDLEKYINMDYDKYFNELKDILAEKGESNLSEAEIEKLTDSVLNKLNDINSSVGDVVDSTEKLGGKIDEGNSLLSKVAGKIDESNSLLSRIYGKLNDLDDYVENKLSLSAPGGLMDKLDGILETLNGIKRWAVVDTVIDGVDAVADWLDLIHGVLSDFDSGAESAVSAISSALDGGVSLLKDKFPFSVPWDILFFITLLAAEPEVPHFEVPIDFDISAVGISVHYDFIVDFTDYQYLSDIFRTILSMTYCVGLIKMTAGIINTKKEG